MEYEKKQITNIIFVLITIVVCTTSLSANSITVSEKSAFSSIRQAYESADIMDTIIILQGTYYESELEIEKSIVIIGENQPVIDGNNKGTILTIKANDVMIKGVTFTGTPISYIEEYAAVLIEKSHDCIIQDCHFYNNFFSIYLSQSSNCIIRNNIISGDADSESNSGNGIHLWYCKNITIIENETYNNRDGIYFEFVKNCIIKNNKSRNNLRYGLHFMYSDSCKYISNIFENNGAGVAVMYTKYVDMIDNYFIKNQGPASYGLLLKDISDSRIQNNTFRNNTIGTYIESSNRLFISENDFIENGWAVKLMSSSIDNLFIKNNFVGNSFQIATNSTNNNSRFERNYWSDYKGYDLDRDGFGDIPFRPVSLFALEVEKRPPTLILLHSIFIDLLTYAEKIIPTFTPETLIDQAPSMSMIE